MESSFSDLTLGALDETLSQISRKATSILSLTDHWKQLEDHFKWLGKSVDDRCKELQLLEVSIEKREERLLEQEEIVKKRLEEVEAREEELELQSRANVSKKEIERAQNLIQELELARVSFENRMVELGLKEDRFLAMKNLIEDRFEELREKEKQMEKREEELKAKEKDFRENSEKIRQPCTRSRSKIQNLIEKNQRLEAIKLIHEFNLVDRFSPETILLEHLSFLERNTKSCKQNEWIRIGAIRKEITNLRAVAKCIKDYELEADFLLVRLEDRFAELEKEKTKLENSGPRTRAWSRLLQEQDEERFNTRMQQGTGNKRIRVV